MTSPPLRLALLACALSCALAAPAAASDRDRDDLDDRLEQRLAERPSARVIVSMAAEPTRERVASLEDRTGVDASRRLTLVDAFAARGTRAELRALAARPAVELVEPDRRVHAFNDNAQSWFGVTAARVELPGLDGNADGLPTYSSGDLVAAVIDTGIDPGHLDLDDGKLLAFKDFVNDQTEPYDDDGHGTHVSATLAGDGEGRLDGRFRGVAPGAGLVGVKVLDENGNGTDSDVLAAIQWVVQNRNLYGIEAINLSLGSDGCEDSTGADANAVAQARAAGLVVVVAAGNEGPGSCTIGSPGTAPAALTVGAMADVSRGGFYAADFSSRGPTEDGLVKPDVMGPGVSITSAVAETTTGYANWNGTSMATPFVTGLALLMREQAPAITPLQVKEAIMDTAVDWGPAGPDPDYGAGRLDAYAALAAAGADLDSPPAVPGHAHFGGELSATGDHVDIAVAVEDESLPLAATVIRPEFGLLTTYSASLIAPNGSTLDTDSTTGRQIELYGSPGGPGDYVLRVSSGMGAGSFDADLSGGFDGPAVDVSPPEPPPLVEQPPPPDLAGAVRSSARQARRALARLTARRLRRQGAFAFRAAAPTGGTFGVRVRSGTFTVARGRQSLDAAGSARIRVRLTRAGRRLLRFSRRPRCAVRVTFTVPGGETASARAVTRPRRAAAR